MRDTLTGQRIEHRGTAGERKQARRDDNTRDSDLLSVVEREGKAERLAVDTGDHPFIEVRCGSALEPFSVFDELRQLDRPRDRLPDVGAIVLEAQRPFGVADRR